MTRLKVFLTGLGLIALLTACNDEDLSVYKELLTETLWYSAYPVPVADGEAEYADIYIYSFDETGILTVYPSDNHTALPGTSHRYIYNPDKATMAIEGLGLLNVAYFDPDRIELGNGENIEMELQRFTGDVEFPDND